MKKVFIISNDRFNKIIIYICDYFSKNKKKESNEENTNNNGTGYFRSIDAFMGIGCKADAAETAEEVTEEAAEEEAAVEEEMVEETEEVEVVAEKTFRIGYSCYGWEIPWMVFYQEIFDELIARRVSKL